MVYLITLSTALIVFLLGYAVYLSLPDDKVSQNASQWLTDHPATQVDGWEIQELVWENEDNQWEHTK